MPITYGSDWELKVVHQILGRKFYKNTEKSSLYSQSILISFIEPQ